MLYNGSLNKLVLSSHNSYSRIKQTEWHITLVKPAVPTEQPSFKFYYILNEQRHLFAMVYAAITICRLYILAQQNGWHLRSRFRHIVSSSYVFARFPLSLIDRKIHSYDGEAPQDFIRWEQNTTQVPSLVLVSL